MKPVMLVRTILYGLLLLFFFQLVADFVEATYAFGLLSLSLTVESASVLLLLSPLALLLVRRELPGWVVVLLGWLVLGARVAEPVLDTRGRMLVAGLGVACWMVLLPVLLARPREDSPGAHGRTWGLGLALGVCLSILLRAWGSGTDLSTQGGWLWVGWLLALLAGALMAGLWRVGAAWTPGLRREDEAGAQTHAAPVGDCFWGTAGLALGATSGLMLLYFSFTSPTVVARWTGAPYLLVVSLAVLALTAAAAALVAPRVRAVLTPPVVGAWNLLFVLSLVLTLLSYQIDFPADASAYPLPAPPVQPWQLALVCLTALLFPVIVVDGALFARELGQRRPSLRSLGGGFALAGLVFLVLILGHIFTTVYDYIPVVGPFFRDRFWLVYLVAAAGVALPVLLVRRPALAGEGDGRQLALSGLVGLLGAAAVAGVLFTAADPMAPLPGETSLTVLTYNLQQGYSEDGQKNLDGQLDVLREVDADLIGLQECDKARIAGGNGDLVRYFADQLDLHAVYGPKTVVGTFGIALLSKTPIHDVRTFYMFSAGEQTATIQAQISVGGQMVHVFVTHLGNGGPLVQQEAVLRAAEGLENVVLMGDFNFRPDTEQYRLTTARLDDAWLLRWPGGAADQGIDPARRIDHIFVSPATQVHDARYLPGPASDHPALVAVVEW